MRKITILIVTGIIIRYNATNFTSLQRADRLSQGGQTLGNNVSATKITLNWET